MGLTALSYLNGISAMCLFLLGIYFCVCFFIYYKQQKKKLLPYVGILALSLGSFYFGATTAFIVKVFYGQDLNVILYGLLTYLHLPIGLSLAVFLAYNIFKPHLKWRMLAIYSLIAIIYIAAMIGWPSSMISGTDPAEDILMDVNIKSVVLIIAIFYIFSAFFILGGNFLLLRKKLEEDVPRIKALQLGIGWILFGMAGILETFNPLNISIVPRTIMFIGFVLIFSGFRPLKKDQ